MIIFETERLIHRRLIPGDLDPLARLYADPEVRRYYPEGTLTREQTREEIEWFLNGDPKHPAFGLWATVFKATGAFIGRCGLLPCTLRGRDEVEVAYMIDPAHWGQGLGTEAASGVRDHAFGSLGLARLHCLIEHGNTASERVAERMGMRFIRDDEDEKGPFRLYGMERGDWQRIGGRAAAGTA